MDLVDYFNLPPDRRLDEQEAPMEEDEILDEFFEDEEYDWGTEDDSDDLFDDEWFDEDEEFWGIDE